MVKFVPLIDAKNLAKSNRRELEALEARRALTVEQAQAAQTNLDEAYTEAFEEFLAPFADAFSRLKGVDLGSLPTVDVVPELGEFDVELLAVSLRAIEGLTALAGGTVAGAAAGGLTFAAVGTLATASTGAAIGGLSGAAATSATLAWLGGGSLAAGGWGVAGGTAVLTGVVAAPLLLAGAGFLWWKGDKALKTQLTIQEDIRRAKAQLDVDLAKASLAISRVFDTARVVRTLITTATTRLGAFQALVSENDNYSDYTSEQRDLVAALAAVATAMAAVIACPVLDDDGMINPLSDETLAAADAVGDRLGK